MDAPQVQQVQQMQESIPIWVQWAFNILLLIVGGLVSWLMSSIFDRIKDLQKADTGLAKEVNDLKVALPTNYVLKTEHTEGLNAIFSALRRIEDKLDNKADKP
jgi:hypothetical protein